MAVSFGGGTSNKKVSTTDLRHTCTDNFSGTSAAAPLATAIFALGELTPLVEKLLFLILS